MKHFFLLIILLSHKSSFSQKDLSLPFPSSSESIGDYMQIALPVFALGSTLIWKDGQKGGLQATKTIISTVIITHLLKVVINKERPNGGQFSFPSGHTSSAFSGAGFLQKRYGWKVGAPAYALATYVGLSRIKANKHDGWDVLAGAIIGTGMSYLFTKPYKSNQDIKLTIGTINNTATVGFVYQF